jgi:aminoglycoside 6'-N-acetyltransferase I
MENVVVRRAGLEDIAEIAAMCHYLWPDSCIEQHAEALMSLLAGVTPGKLPTVVLLAQHPDRQSVGFIEIGLRSHADGCNPPHPVRYIEGC